MQVANPLNRSFWFISAPTNHIRVPEIKEHCRGSADSVEIFPIPGQLRVGTPDDLYALNDDLVKVDSFVENMVKKIVKQMLDLAEEDEKASKEKKSGSPDMSKLFTVGNVNMETYMRRFEWHHAKFKVSNTLKEIVEAISVETTQLDEELRTMQSEYLSIGHAIDAFERNKTGNLQVRDLSFVIEEKHWVDSPHLTTLFVVIPRSATKEWDQQYESLVEGAVVPRSSAEVFRDDETCLRSVVLFKHCLDEFKQKVLRKKWTVRDFKFDSTAMSQRQEEADEQKEKKKKLRSDLIRWCRTNFSEAYSNWVHLKALKVFAESILRFGLPRDFICLVIEPKPKSQKKLRGYLDSTFKSLGSVYLQGDVGDIVLVGTTTEKFFSYVFTEIAL